jgi:hypothetical protein
MLQADETNTTTQNDVADDHEALFDRCLAAERLWRHHLETVWSKTLSGTAEYERVDLESDILSDTYDALFQQYCDFAIENPSLQALGNVVVLWRLRCWDADGEPGVMADNFEARAIVRISESLSGIKH